MTTVLVTGANGFVGRVLCAELVKHGYKVRGVVRDLSHTTGLQCELTTMQDIGDAGWPAVLDGMDIVVHLAARVHVMSETVSDPLSMFRETNVKGTLSLARQAAAAGVRRFVFISSIKVNGEHTALDKPFTEDDAANPQDAYGISKLEAEQGLLPIAQQTGMEVVIIRPPLVYGAGVKGNFAQMIQVLANGIPLPFASVQNLRSFIYVGNLVDALIVCATHPAAVGRTYIVSDGEDISTSGLLRQLGNAMGRPARLFFCPPALLKIFGRLIGKSDQIERLLGSLQVDSSKIRHELGWKPPFSLQNGLTATVQALVSGK